MLGTRFSTRFNPLNPKLWCVAGRNKSAARILFFLAVATRSTPLIRLHERDGRLACQDKCIADTLLPIGTWRQPTETRHIVGRCMKAVFKEYSSTREYVCMCVLRGQDWAPSRGHATWPEYSGNAYLIIRPPDTLSVSVYVGASFPMLLIELGLIVPDVCLVNFTSLTDSVFVRLPLTFDILQSIQIKDCSWKSFEPLSV